MSGSSLAGSVEAKADADGGTYYYNGNVFLRAESTTAHLCNFFQTLEEVETRYYCYNDDYQGMYREVFCSAAG